MQCNDYIHRPCMDYRVSHFQAHVYPPAHLWSILLPPRPVSLPPHPDLTLMPSLQIQSLLWFPQHPGLSLGPGHLLLLPPNTSSLFFWQNSLSCVGDLELLRLLTNLRFKLIIYWWDKNSLNLLRSLIRGSRWLPLSSLDVPDTRWSLAVCVAAGAGIGITPLILGQSGLVGIASTFYPRGRLLIS